jgi:diacylglycerol kinase family enzyme
MKLEIDGRRIDGENCFVAFCNSRYTGGRVLMAPDAAIDDGGLDVVVVGPLSRRSLLATFPKTLLPDGEWFGSTPTRVAVLPRRFWSFA